jgi:hypothetical protein
MTPDSLCSPWYTRHKVQMQVPQTTDSPIANRSKPCGDLRARAELPYGLSPPPFTHFDVHGIEVYSIRKQFRYWSFSLDCRCNDLVSIHHQLPNDQTWRLSQSFCGLCYRCRLVAELGRLPTIRCHQRCFADVAQCSNESLQ